MKRKRASRCRGLYRAVSTVTDELGRKVRRPSRFWSFRYTHPGTGERKSVPLRVEDRRTAENLANEIRLKVERGTFDPFTEHPARPLAEHVDDWCAALQARGNTGRHAEQHGFQVRRIIDGCGFRRLPDLSRAKVERFIASLTQAEPKRKAKRRAKPKPARTLSAEARNHYRRAVKGLTRWLLQEERIGRDPLAGMKLENAGPDRRVRRRALLPHELRLLFDAAKHGPDRLGIGGPDRAQLYRMAAGTGLRSSELRSLTWASFDLDGDPPTVTVEAAYSLKNKRTDTLPLTASLAAMLRGWRAQRATERGRHAGFPHAGRCERREDSPGRPGRGAGRMDRRS